MTYSPDAAPEDLYAEFLGQEEMTFEGFCAFHQEHASELRSLHEASLGLSAMLGAPSSSASQRSRLSRDGSPLTSTSRQGAVALSQDGAVGRPSARLLVREKIGEGGMGSVYRVFDEDLGRDLAMKILKKGASGSVGGDRDRFLQEGVLTAQLDHPSIVPVHRRGIDRAGRVFFTMKLVRGISLEELLQRQPAGQIDEVLSVLIRVCDALAYAHERGVIHRDLKPSNVMVGRFGEVYLMDWGLARRPQADAGGSAGEGSSTSPFETGHGEVLGTPAYMAPEQAAGDQARVTSSADLYGVGALLYHVIGGSAPYCDGQGSASAAVVLQRLRSGTPTALRRGLVPPELLSICRRAMARRPQDRYGSAEELQADLVAFQTGRPVRADSVGALGRTLRWVGRHQMATGTIAATLLVGGFAMWRLVELGDRIARQTALDAASTQAAVIQEVSALYSENVVARLPREYVEVTHDYRDREGAVPLPATFLTELGERLSQQVDGLEVRHFSDAPFSFRPAHSLDGFERGALVSLRENPEEPVVDFRGGAEPLVRLALPRQMTSSCVDCHNAHPMSPRRDWSVGDVRGVLEVRQSLAVGGELRRYGLQWLVGAAGGLLALALGAVLATLRGGGRR